MNRWFVRIFLVALLWLGFPYPSPAPLIYRPGEGWIYEPVGSTGEWAKGRAKDQLEVAKNAFEKKDYKLAVRAARRTVSMWPLSDYAPEAQYILARCYEAKGSEEKAFEQYQKLIEKYPKVANHQEIIRRQYDIACHYLAGKWFWKWGFIPLFSSMDRTADMFDKVIKNGPYTEVAPQAQIAIGTAREKQKDYVLAVKAYERAADRYNDQKQVAADATYKAGMAYYKQARTAEYDQSVAGQAIATFSDFAILYPTDPRVAETRKLIGAMKTEQARGSYAIGEYYEKRARYDGALIYYNEVLLQDPNSSYAVLAKSKIETLKLILETRKKMYEKYHPVLPASQPAPTQPPAKP